ncbi:hypothetical protein K4K53_002512 [Colletotrichum sp. SAR 10_77]|nr:hypothetical protein K4K53_002512 [Colletotrichum sp. SAR 10_77]
MFFVVFQDGVYITLHAANFPCGFAEIFADCGDLNPCDIDNTSLKRRKGGRHPFIVAGEEDFRKESDFPPAFRQSSRECQYDEKMLQDSVHIRPQSFVQFYFGIAFIEIVAQSLQEHRNTFQKGGEVLKDLTVLLRTRYDMIESAETLLTGPEDSTSGIGNEAAEELHTR